MNTWQEQALHHAKTALPDESCGVVINVKGTEQYFPCKNIAIKGANSFTLDPEDWAKAEETGTVLHICHSHPNQDLTPSEEDIKNCDHIGLSWFIFDPINDEISELKPKEHKPMLSRDKFVNRERTEEEKSLRKIKIYGRLAELVGSHVSYADVKTLKDVYRYFICNHPEIEPYFLQNMYRITIDNNGITNEKDLLMNSEGEIRIIPIVSGSFFFVAAALFAGGAAVSAIGTGLAIAIGGALTSMAVSMTIQGVSNLLFPPQQPNIGDVTGGLSETDSRVNYSFSGIQNVSRSGVCIPLIYGEVFCGSIVVSSGTDTAPVFKS